MKSKIKAAEKQRYDKIKLLIALLCAENKNTDIVPESPLARSFTVGKSVKVDGETIRIKNKLYEARQIQKIIINTEGSIKIFDRYGKKLCGSLTLNSSSNNIGLFCIWARKNKIPAETVSGIPEKVILAVFLGLVTLVVELVKVLSRI